MAYYVDSDITYGVAVTAIAMNVPAHLTNDILVMYVVVNTVATVPSITTGTGWAAFVTESSTVANTGHWTWKRAASDAELVSLTTADDYTCSIHCIRDVDTTTAIDVSATSGVTVATSAPVNAAVTTTTADCFILYLMSVEGIAVGHGANPGVHHINSFDSGGTTAATSSSQGAAWYIQRAVGLTPAPAWTCSVSGVYTRVTLAFRNLTGGVIPAYIDDVSSPAAVVTPGHHIIALNNIVYAAALTNTAAVNGKTVALVAAALQADLGIVPFSNGVAKAAAIAAKTTMNGFEITLTGGRDWSTGLLMGSFIGATPKMGTFGMGSIAQGGCVIRIGSSATAWNAYQVAAKNSVPTLEVRSVWAIQPGYTASAYGTTQGTAVTTTAITYFQVLANQPSFASNAPLSEVYQVFTQIIAGGTAQAPVDTDGLAIVGKSFRLPVIQKSGGYGLLSYAPLQIGGGDAVNFQIDAGSLQFPRRYDTAKKEIAFHAADNTVGISYAGKSGDVIKHTNSVITSPTSYFWNINAAATSAATWDFTGLTIVNAAIVLRNVMTFDSMTFSNCPSIDASGVAITKCVFSKLPLGNNSLTLTDTSTLATCTINTTGITAANYWTSVASPVYFSGCTFTGSATSGHAIRITTAGTYTFVSNQFIGYGADTSTSASIFNDSGGLVTLNISGGGSTPTFRNGTGATTVINNTKTLTLTGMQTLSDIVLLGTGGTINLPASSVSITYVGAWGQDNLGTGGIPRAFSTAAGQTATITTDAEAVTFRVMRDFGWGTASVTVNGINYGTLTSYDASGGGFLVDQHISGLPAGNKNVVITSLDAGTAPFVFTNIIYDTSVVELVDLNQNVGSTYAYSYNYIAGTYIVIAVFKAGRVPFYIRNYLLPNADGSLPIAQIIDRAYAP